jgi:hypothetical protein
MANVLGLFGALSGQDPPADQNAASAAGSPLTSQQFASGDDKEDEYDMTDERDTEDAEPPPDNQDFSEEFPKIHVNGGRGSGINTWKRIMNQVDEVYNLYKLSMGESLGASLSQELFPELKGVQMTWDIFCTNVKERELNKYSQTIGSVGRKEIKRIQSTRRCTFREKSYKLVKRVARALRLS